MLTSQQADEFAKQGFILIPQVVPGPVLSRAARRVDALVAADPPPDAARGSHFYFLDASQEPALTATLTGTPAFGLAGDLAGPGTLEVPGQVQVALNGTATGAARVPGIGGTVRPVSLIRGRPQAERWT